MATGRRPTRAAVSAVACLALEGCGGSGDGTSGSDDAASPAPSSSSDATVTSSAPTSTPPVGCDNPEGGECVNELEPGRRYVTTVFEPAITYDVAEDGWANYEDTPGNFLLVPPGNNLDGVNDATSDFIGVYTSVTASEFAALEGCYTQPAPGVPRTPSGMVAWLQRRPVLDVSSPERITISGLRGLRTDVRIARGRKPTTCSIGGTAIDVELLVSGLTPSSFDHGVERHDAPSLPAAARRRPDSRRGGRHRRRPRRPRVTLRPGRPAAVRPLTGAPPRRALPGRIRTRAYETGHERPLIRRLLSSFTGRPVELDTARPARPSQIDEPDSPATASRGG